MTKTTLICAVTRRQGSWKWQKRGALSRYIWNGRYWQFDGHIRDSLRYDHACEQAEYVGRPPRTLVPEAC